MSRTLVCLLLVSLLCVPPADARVRVVTTLTDLGAIAKAVGGELVEVTSLAKGYQDPHRVDAKPSFILELSRADLFVLVGMDLEIAWVPQLLDAARNPKIQRGGPGYVDASKGVSVLERPGSGVTRAEGDIHVYGNPHYWLDPENGKVIAHNIAEALKKVDSKNAAAYAGNLAGFTTRVDDLLRRTQEKMRPFRGRKIVCYHNTWPYFIRRYGLEVIGFLEPKPGIPPSGAHLAQLIPTMKAESVKVICKEVFFAESVARRIAQQTGAQVVELPTSVGGVKGADDYLLLFEVLVDRVTTALR